MLDPQEITNRISTLREKRESLEKNYTQLQRQSNASEKSISLHGIADTIREIDIRIESHEEILEERQMKLEFTLN